MADTAAGVYVEIIAPDMRPGGLLIALIVGILASLMMRGAWRRTRESSQARGLLASNRALWAGAVGWLVAWVAWLGVSGNGRYVLPLLLMVGPLLGAALWRLPVRTDWKWLILALILAGQSVMLHSASPSMAWSMLKSRWTGPDPWANQQELLEAFNADLIIFPRAQTMTALLVNTPAARSAQLLSLDFAESMGLGSDEQKRAWAAIESASRPILVDAFNIDYIDSENRKSLSWRRESQELLERYGLQVEGAGCKRALSSLNVMQVVCGLKRIHGRSMQQRQEPAPLAEKRMMRLIELCGSSLWPHGAKYVQPDGSLVQVFRETRYVIRAAPDGSLHVRWRQDLNFRQRWSADGTQPWEKMTCDAIIRRGVS